MLRAIIADDHALLRSGLRSLLVEQLSCEIVAEAIDAPHALEAVRQHRPDFVTIDLSMPGWGGSIIESIRNHSADTAIVAYTMHDDPVSVRSTLASGAKAYVLKSSPSETLLEGIRTALRGESFLDPVLEATVAPPKSATVELSRREREVLEMIVRGLTHLEIAEQMLVSVKTVETYRARIREKTGLKSRAELTQFGINAGLIVTPPPIINEPRNPEPPTTDPP
jgi:two-component system, NarL family, response regulator NreC